MVITSEIVCRTSTVRGQAKKNNVSIPRKTGKSTIVTHGTIRVKIQLEVCVSFWWLIRVSLVVAFGFLPPNFGRW